MNAPNNSTLVLRAFATLTNSAPSHADYTAHLQFIQAQDLKSYVQTLDQAFAGHSDEQLATLLLQSTGLNGIDLEGDGNTDNLKLATDFIHANAGHRVQAMLDLIEQLANITSGPLAPIARDYNQKIHDGHAYANDPGSAQAVPYNDHIQVQGSTGNDVHYGDNSGSGQYLVGGNVVNSKALWIFNTAEQSQLSESQKVAQLQGGTPTTVGSYGVKVQVSYRGLLSQAIAIDDKADFQANQQDINQAIKQAIQGDPVLSQLLEVIDGPGGTLGVLSKTDGLLTEAALDLKFIAPSLNELTPEVVAGFSARHPNAGVQDAAGLLRHIENHVTSANTQGSLHHDFYAHTQMALDDKAAPILGHNSDQARDHLIHGSTGNDLIVLGTAWHPTGALRSSNDTVKYSAAFDHDTLVNFEAGPVPGADRLDFTALNRASDATVTSLHKADIAAPTASVVGAVTDGQIRLVHKHAQEGTTAATTDNDSAQDVQQLFTDAATGTAARQIYIAVDSQTGTGDVYQVVDGAGANDLSVTLLGHITLANHPFASTAYDWASLTENNFV